MKKRTVQNYADALFELIKDAPKNAHEKIILEFSKLLVRNRMLHQSQKIIEAFLKRVQKEEGASEVEVTTAHKLDEESKIKLKSTLGSHIVMVEKNNPQLLGGIVVKTEDTILDGSLRTQLIKLKQALGK